MKRCTDEVSYSEIRLQIETLEDLIQAGQEILRFTTEKNGCHTDPSQIFIMGENSDVYLWLTHKVIHSGLECNIEAELIDSCAKG